MDPDETSEREKRGTIFWEKFIEILSYLQKKKSFKVMVMFQSCSKFVSNAVSILKQMFFDCLSSLGIKKVRFV